MPSIEFIDYGVSPYAEILKIQEDLFEENLRRKENNEPTKNTILFCQHLPVFTLGKSGKRENILVSDNELNADFYHVSRGGDVTFHGPGQLVVYPILDLEQFGWGLAHYIFLLEEVIISALFRFGIKGERLEGAAGIWLIGNEKDKSIDRKICAIGVKASRNITMHGLAVNVSTDLSWFSKIVPCGLLGRGVTSLELELHREVTMGEFSAIMKEELIKALQPKKSGVS